MRAVQRKRSSRRRGAPPPAHRGADPLCQIGKPRHPGCSPLENAGHPAHQQSTQLEQGSEREGAPRTARQGRVGRRGECMRNVGATTRARGSRAASPGIPTQIGMVGCVCEGGGGAATQGQGIPGHTLHGRHAGSNTGSWGCSLHIRLRRRLIDLGVGQRNRHGFVSPSSPTTATRTAATRSCIDQARHRACRVAAET